MPLSYLEVTNLALREVNEVPLTTQQFINARGLQQFAKEAVNRAYFDITTSDHKWPFLHDVENRRASTERLLLVAGTQWYDINPTTEDNIEVSWDSFYLSDVDPDIGGQATISRNLCEITYDEWIVKYRERDYLGDSNSQGIPQYVIRHPNKQIGFSSIPDAGYFVEYHAYRSGTRFVDPDDVMVFPEEFITVLLSRIRYYLWLFRENKDQAAFAQADFDMGLVNMKRLLLSNKEVSMRAV